MATEIIFVLRASHETDSKEEAEKFCQELKSMLLEYAPASGIKAEVEYSIVTVNPMAPIRN